MSLKTFTTLKALKMLKYFGWPEWEEHRLVFNGKEWERYFWDEETKGWALSHIIFGDEPHEVLAILQAHCWKIIRERYDYAHSATGQVHKIELYTKHRSVHQEWDISGYDLNTLLENTCTWIMNRELKENENG